MLIGRAVLFEVTRGFLGALAASTGLAFFLMSLGFMKKFPGVGLGALLEICPFFFPLALQFSAPLSVLVAVVLTFSRMQMDRELTALSASGVNLFTIIRPVLAGAALVSVVLLLLIDVASPFAAAQLRDASRDLPQHMQTSFRSGMRDIPLQGRARISFESYDRGNFRDILIEVRRGRGRPTLFRALDGSLEVSDRGEVRFRFAPLQAIAPPDAPPAGEDGAPARERKGRRFVSIDEVAGEILVDETILSGGLSRKRGDLRARELAYVGARGIDTEQYKGARVGSLDATEELARRSALAGSAFFFALAGIALGILAGNRAKVASVIAACAPIIVIYFPLVIAGSSLARAGILPAYPALWIGNAVLAVGGTLLLYRVARR